MAIERVLTFHDALGEVLAHAQGIFASSGVETLPLIEAHERILAEPIVADRDQPPFDRSTRDGYAVRAMDVTNTAQFRVTGSVRAGEHWTGAALIEGEAIEIMTGAPLPQGADAVIMVEYTSVAQNGMFGVEAGRVLRPGENVVARGAEAREGDRLLPVGRLMRSAEIAVVASCGKAELAVHRKPKVAIVATGDELVELADTPAPWQIRNSNSYALTALVQAEGGEPHSLPIARDTLDELRNRIAQGREQDLLLLSGGVSMGKYDLVEQVLEEAGAEFIFTGAMIQPGKPVVFGRLPNSQADNFTYFFGLPGNPVSTQVCFHLFVAPLLRALAGRTELAPTFLEATLAESVKGSSRVTRFLPAELSSSWQGASARVVSWQGSGDVGANARGNCYAVFPADTENLPAGERVSVLLR